MLLIILREHGTETPVDEAEDDGVRQGLGEAGRARGESEENPRRQEDEENHGDEDVCVKGGHLYGGT